MDPVVRGAGYIIFRRRIPDNMIEYLLLQSSSDSHHWSPPKGHVDPGENEEQASIREVKEESGYCASDLNTVKGFKKVIQYSSKKSQVKRIIYWLAELIDPAQDVCLSKDHQDYKWLSLEEACRIATYPATKELLLECHQWLLSSLLSN